MDRTPQQMREDALMWSRCGYPAVAVGRYRDAADQVQRLHTANLRLRDFLLARAKECPSCGGTGIVTVLIRSGSKAGEERQEKCGDCESLRAVLA